MNTSVVLPIAKLAAVQDRPATGASDFPVGSRRCYVDFRFSKDQVLHHLLQTGDPNRELHLVHGVVPYLLTHNYLYQRTMLWAPEGTQIASLKIDFLRPFLIDQAVTCTLTVRSNEVTKMGPRVKLHGFVQLVETTLPRRLGGFCYRVRLDLLMPATPA